MARGIARGLTKGHRRIVLTPHFIKRWGQRIEGKENNTQPFTTQPFTATAPSKIKSICRSAVMNKELMLLGTGRHSKKSYYAVEIMKCRAVCVIDVAGEYVFLTVLTGEMVRKDEARKNEARKAGKEVERQ